MKDNITISIITSVKNDAIGLEKTLNSISKQSAFSCIEHIIIDGLSADGTTDIINKYEIQISKWISEKDSGLYFAMNKGIDLASGDFALFMNAGDEFYTFDVIEKILINIRDLNTVYFGNSYIYNGNFSIISGPLKSNNKNQIDQYLPHHQSIFYPKIFYKNQKYDTNFKVLADANYTLRACKGNPVQFIDLNIIRSLLNGYGISQYAKLSSLKKMIKENKLLNNKSGIKSSNLLVLKIYINHFLKYLFLVAFGNKGVILLMHLNRKITHILNLSLYK